MFGFCRDTKPCVYMYMCVYVCMYIYIYIVRLFSASKSSSTSFWGKMYFFWILGGDTIDGNVSCQPLCWGNRLPGKRTWLTYAAMVVQSHMFWVARPSNLYNDFMVWWRARPTFCHFWWRSAERLRSGWNQLFVWRDPACGTLMQEDTHVEWRGVCKVPGLCRQRNQTEEVVIGLHGCKPMPLLGNLWQSPIASEPSFPGHEGQVGKGTQCGAAGGWQRGALRSARRLWRNHAAQWQAGCSGKCVFTKGIQKMEKMHV